MAKQKISDRVMRRKAISAKIKELAEASGCPQCIVMDMVLDRGLEAVVAEGISTVPRKFRNPPAARYPELQRVMDEKGLTLEGLAEQLCVMPSYLIQLLVVKKGILTRVLADRMESVLGVKSVEELGLGSTERRSRVETIPPQKVDNPVVRLKNMKMAEHVMSMGMTLRNVYDKLDGDYSITYFMQLMNGSLAMRKHIAARFEGILGRHPSELGCKVVG